MTHNEIKSIIDNSAEECINESTKYNLTKSDDRIKDFGEVFTPTELVLKILKELPEDCWDENEIFCDPTCGNGQFLAAIRIVLKNLKRANPIDLVYGVDIQEDNCLDTIVRLYNYNRSEIKLIPYNEIPAEHRGFKVSGLRFIFEYNGNIIKNVVCADGLIYDYCFGEVKVHTGSTDHAPFFGQID